MNRMLLCMCLAVLAGGCQQVDQSPPTTAVAASNSETAVAKDVALPGLPAAADPASPEGQGSLDTSSEARQREAERYLDQAIKAARMRFEQSMQNCAERMAEERSDCENAAASAEEAELRAARVEFDLRMSSAQSLVPASRLFSAQNASMKHLTKTDFADIILVSTRP